MARPRNFDEADVVAKATDVFWAHGYRRTTPALLMEATGLSKGSLYNTFGSKAGLFRRALDGYLEQNKAQMEAMLAGDDLEQVLRGLYACIIGTSLPLACGGHGRSCLMATATIETDASEPELVAHVGGAARIMVGVFEARLQRARDEGAIGADRDPAALAWFLFNTNMGLVLLARAGTPREALEQVADQAVRSVFT